MTSKSSSQLAPEKIGVKTVPTEGLHPNPHNPRVLFDKVPLNILKNSIRKVGILVPLTVFWSKDRQTYVILDGQRRWICAQKLNLKKVPVNVIAEPSTVQNIVTMFQIHKTREDWELMPTALKLQVLMDELKEQRDKELADLTGLDQAVCSRCKKLLSFPKRNQELMLDPDPERRVSADFFIELHPVLHDRVVSQMDWFKPNDFTNKMLVKYQSKNGAIKAVTDFRVIKQHISNAKRVGREKTISKRLKEFTENEGLLIAHLEIPAARIGDFVRKLNQSISKIINEIENLEVEEFYGEEEFWRQLENLMKVIRKKLEEADRRIK